LPARRSAIAARRRRYPNADQLMAQLRTDDLGWQLEFSKEQADDFYEELSRSAASL
jgi:hypothetical protein